MRPIILYVLAFVFSLVAEAQVKPFNFAQLTDIHLNPNNEKPTEYLMKSIQQINEKNNVDFVLVTGDLTEHGDRATLEKVKHCLDQLKVPYYTYLGNHETTWSASGCTAFSDVFGPERIKFEHNGVVFIGFNSGPLLHMAYGHVNPEDISWAETETEKAKSENKPVVIVTHYPMLDGDVDNWYDVTDALRKAGNVVLFIGGHYHALKLHSYDGIPGILMRSNLLDGEKNIGYGFYEVTEKEIKAYVQNVGKEKKWAATYALKANYDPKGKAEHYPDFSDNKRYNQVKENWVVQTGGAIFSSPAIEKGRVFAGDDKGVMSAYSLKDGKRIWSFKSGRRIVGTPAVSKGVLVFGSADKYIYGLNTKDGSVRWKVQARQPVLGAVTIDKGVAFIGASDSTFRAINLKTGQEVWAYRGVTGYIMTKPLVTKDKVIFGAWDNYLYCVDRTNGKELWKWSAIKGMHFSPAQVWPVEANGKVFIADPKRAMTAINIKTGETVWRTFQSKVRETIGLSADRKRIYSKTMQDSLVCYSALENTPVELWACNVGFGYEHGPSMPQEKGGIVFESTKEGLIFAIDGKTGTLLWKHKIGNSFIPTVVPLNKNEVVFTSSSGELGKLSIQKR